MVSFFALSSEIDNDDRTKFNYQMLCQGCHVGDGRGGKSVPNMKDRVGIFLNTQQGREYLVRVPGAANSAIDSKELAELLNWIMKTIGKESTPKNFIPFTEQEVHELRKNPLMEVVKYRAMLMKEISNLPN
ncbi:cytochrome c, class I [Pseudocolwellia sp. HL-MZ19]|uniref:cytochrome c, class I n=1 Tax=Pseudocolwellia sp. HL-MZ19 TaxID=3400846 RepID=UPI003CE8C581